MIPEPQIQIMQTQTPYGRRTVRIIRAPNVINLQKRGTLIATRWLASSPYAKYQEITDEMNREYLRKLGEYARQMQRWKMEMENYTTSQIKQLRQKYDEMLKEQLRTIATTYSDLLYMRLINLGINPNKAREIVLDFLTRSYVPMAQATEILSNLEKRYKPKVQTTQPSTPSYSSGSSRRVSHSSHVSSVKPIYQDIVYSGSTPPSLATSPEIKMQQINEVAERVSSTKYKEIPTTKPNVTAVVDESGKITCYHDYNRGISIPVTIPTTPSTTFSSLQRDIQRQRMVPWNETVYVTNYSFG